KSGRNHHWIRDQLHAALSRRYAPPKGTSRGARSRKRRVKGFGRRRAWARVLPSLDQRAVVGPMDQLKDTCVKLVADLDAHHLNPSHGSWTKSTRSPSAASSTRGSDGTKSPRSCQ